ncbi:hypothetical protein MMC11_007127 [Xylographa trunciseda]|nr:hypothetical protein [Xylographa trunciseda]
MSFGYGVGDLLAIANTIERIVVEIKAYRSAPSNFQRLAVELELLTKTCTQILQIEPTQADDKARMDNIRKSMCLCLGPLKAFAEKMRGSEDSLGVTKWLAENQGGLSEDTDLDNGWGQGHRNTVRRRYRSVKDRLHWSMIASKEVDELRAVVAGQLVAVDTLLNIRTWGCLTAATFQSKEISEQLQSLIDDTRAASEESKHFYLSAKAVAMSQWDEIQRWQTLNEEERTELKKALLAINETNEEARSWTEMLVNSVGYWGEQFQDQVGNLTRVNNSFAAYMKTFIASCASITEMIERNFHTLLNVYEVLVRIERMILAKAIELPYLRFDDPFGETLALPYQMCNTWLHFTSLLAAMFQDKPGKRLVQRGSFMIMTAKVNKIIDAKQWEHAVRSGDHLSMSMVLRRRSMNLQQCPRCSTVWEDDSRTRQKGRTCNACEFWFSTLDQEPDIAGRVVTTEGESIELYEVPDAPKNDHSSSGPPVLPERRVTSSDTIPMSTCIEDETDEDTSLFRRIHFVIQKFSENIATVVDASKLDSMENIDTSFPPPNRDNKFNDNAEDNLDNEETPIIPISPLPRPKKAKAKHASSQAASNHHQNFPDYRSTTSSPYYFSSSTSGYPKPTPHRYTGTTDNFRSSRSFYYTDYSSQPTIHRSASKANHVSRFLSRQAIDVDEVDIIENPKPSFSDYHVSPPYDRYRQGPGMGYTPCYPSHYCKTSNYNYYRQRSPPYGTTNIQSATSSRLKVRRTTNKPADSPNTAPKMRPPRPATAADRQSARIPAGYSTKNWDPDEAPIILLGSVFDANLLGKWIYDWTAYHHGARSPIADIAGELWLLLIELAGKTKRAESQLSRLRPTDREMILDFLDSGDIIWNRLKKLLKVCEDHMSKAFKRDKRESSSSKDRGIQSPESQKKHKGDEKFECTPQVDEQLGDRGSEAECSTDVQTNDRHTVNGESEGTEVGEEQTTVKTGEGNQSAQLHAANDNLEDKNFSKQKVRDAKAAEGVQMGVNSGIAFVEAIFGRDNELERTEKLMANMRLWILRFEANCEDILHPKPTERTIQRGRRPSIYSRDDSRSRSTTSKALIANVDSGASLNETRTRLTTPNGRPTYRDSIVAPSHEDVLELPGGSAAINAEQTSPLLESERQQAGIAELPDEWDSWGLSTKKGKKKKKKNLKGPITEDLHTQPSVVEVVEVSYDGREEPSLQWPNL